MIPPEALRVSTSAFLRYDAVRGEVQTLTSDLMVREAIEVRRGLEDRLVLGAAVVELQRRGYTVTPPEAPTPDRGWFSDIDDETTLRGVPMWQPCLQADGVIVSLDIWHETKEACDAFIRDEILGKGMI